MKFTITFIIVNSFFIILFFVIQNTLIEKKKPLKDCVNAY